MAAEDRNHGRWRQVLRDTRPRPTSGPPNAPAENTWEAVQTSNWSRRSCSGGRRWRRASPSLRPKISPRAARSSRSCSKMSARRQRTRAPPLPHEGQGQCAEGRLRLFVGGDRRGGRGARAETADPRRGQRRARARDLRGRRAETSWDRFAPVLAAIGTGIGVIGFMTFVGGVIVWAKLTANGFAAAPALGVIPSQDLLVIGAQTLVRQVIWALVAVAGLLLIYVILRQAWGRVGEEEATVVAGHATVLAASGMCFVLLALAIALAPFDHEMRHGDAVIAWAVVIGGALLAAAMGASPSGSVPDDRDIRARRRSSGSSPTGARATTRPCAPPPSCGRTRRRWPGSSWRRGPTASTSRA